MIVNLRNNRHTILIFNVIFLLIYVRISESYISKQEYVTTFVKILKLFI